MDIYGPTHLHGAHALGAPHKNSAGQKQPPEPKGRDFKDEVQFSQEAQQLTDSAHLRKNAEGNNAPSSEVRLELVNRIRSEIASGTYETEAKLDQAVDRLLDRIV
jgi:negative regulator of flagellin synthesis FlgM